MSEPITQIDTTFTPTTVLQDGWYHAAVIRESNIALPETTVYAYCSDNEADALAIAKVLAILEGQTYHDSMQNELHEMAERLKNPPPPLNLPNISTADRPPADVRGFDPADQAAWLWRYYYPDQPHYSPFVVPPP